MRRGAANIPLFAAMRSPSRWRRRTLIGGGLTWRAVASFLARSLRPLVGGLVLLAVARSVAGGAEFRRALSRYTGTAATWPSRVAAVAAACVLVFATGVVVARRRRIGFVVLRAAGGGVRAWARDARQSRRAAAARHAERGVCADGLRAVAARARPCRADLRAGSCAGDGGRVSRSSRGACSSSSRSALRCWCG